ncbi:hypothetical protein DF156_00880 [Burkholderia ubonensis]|uniref:Uncharacterized protein n=2 Tax=Burkholderia ubonensis TaxID=101571 RepID=A0AB74DGQ9_9BURK|nr:hypothetical protein CJO71_25660 [Burkholderia ubonensis]PAJ97240.1 hypothetical protein CJO68_30570 [Burkholderia ubonensis]PAK05761.1 hypothetical protein CJO67_22600 [Burkholderia ubonensis]PAK12665.1 hypothetical protein CJO66_20065 [Burkholderia ubonensis]RQP36547.1 hypothetical protein DF155_11985 [Burkholderia ubonensis]
MFPQILCGAILRHLSRREIQMSNEQKAPPHLFATDDSRTERGSQITQAASIPAVIGPAVIHVSHIAAYEAGSEAA